MSEWISHLCLIATQIKQNHVACAVSLKETVDILWQKEMEFMTNTFTNIVLYAEECWARWT